MTIPLQFASLYDHQEVFVWSDCLLHLGTDFLVGNMVFVLHTGVYLCENKGVAECVFLDRWVEKCSLVFITC